MPDATALQSHRGAVIQGRRGGETRTIHLFSKHLPGAHRGPGPVPVISPATVAPQTSCLPPWDSHPAEKINLERIVVDVQSS